MSQQKKYISNKISVLGSYVVTVGLGYRYCPSWASTCLLSLGADGQPSTDLMKTLLENIENGAANGVHAIDYFNEKCVKCLAPVALIADRPALAVLPYAMGHSADVFCYICVMPTSKGWAFAAIAYTNTFHSWRVSLMRWHASMDIVRSTSVLSENLRKQLWIKSNIRDKESALFKKNQLSYISSIKNQIREHQHAI